MAERRRSRANSTQEPAPVETKNEKKKHQKPKDNQSNNGVVPDGHSLTGVENVEIKTVEDKATSTRPGGPMTLGIDNLAANVDGMV